MSDDLLRRMENTVRRFGGPMAIDDLLPELDAESGVFLSGAGASDVTAANRRAKNVRQESDDTPVALPGEPGDHCMDPNVD